MLIEFSVENYKSFRDRTTFSMIAASIKAAEPKLDEENVIKVNRNLSLLRSAAIYGKNASGKSNLGAALRFMRDMLMYSFKDEIPVSPFRLNVETHKQPSAFEVVFLIDGVQYRYGFELDKAHIVSEWLYYVPSRREYLLFERDENEIRVKSAFKEGRGLEQRTRNNALFLSVVAIFNGSIATKIRNWFRWLRIASGLEDEDFIGITVGNFINNDIYRDEIIDFVRRLDVDIETLEMRTPSLQEKLPEKLTLEDKEALNLRIIDNLRTKHTVYDSAGNPVGIESFRPSSDESQGTNKLIAMAGPLNDALRKGEVLFVDEMDARFHTQMTESIVRLFHSKQTNPHGAQLIFVTHDTNLLNKSLFRRDQIWFVQKDRQGASTLISLADFKERNDADFERRYLEGRYGAVPFIREPDAIWS